MKKFCGSVPSAVISQVSRAPGSRIGAGRAEFDLSPGPSHLSAEFTHRASSAESRVSTIPRVSAARCAIRGIHAVAACSDGEAAVEAALARIICFNLSVLPDSHAKRCFHSPPDNIFYSFANRQETSPKHHLPHLPPIAPNH
ncbi:hypothetical protein SKAU_G00334530 [Synaphobranchus kaupii]|uniref:Uncharacterized protein n=1 Tax=Synaphobranchus kaupii TaxID=118154 RepID=A0A9Q1IIK6_SYNKA|nr:hypothetical protein SKAU_G00334530 [Synaphobranchus kaupii]